MARPLVLLACGGLAVGLGGLGCVVHTNTTTEWVRARASQDFQCPKGQLTIHHNTKHPNRKRAEGCGKSAWYVRVCQNNDCRWVPEQQPPPG